MKFSEADLHCNPTRYSHMERAAAMFNMMTRRAKLPDSWIVEIPIKKPPHEPILFGESQAVRRAELMEAFMLGLAMASGTISVGKCREWALALGFNQPHEISSFGGAIRDAFSVDDDEERT